MAKRKSSTGYPSPGKAKVNHLRTSTHRGRSTGQQPSNGSFGKSGMAKLTAPMMMAKMAPTPSGPEPGPLGKRSKKC